MVRPNHRASRQNTGDGDNDHAQQQQDESEYSEPIESDSSLSTEDIDYLTSLNDGDSKTAAEIAHDVTDLAKEELTWVLASDRQEVDKVLEHYCAKGTKKEGWCLLSQLKPTKPGGYIQISWAGLNKFTTLGAVVAFAGRSSKIFHDRTDEAALREGLDASHLCGNTTCMTVGHAIFEAAHLNQLRKGCEVWVECPHDGKKIFVCKHNPPCIKYAEGFEDMEDLMARGICNGNYPAREYKRKDV